MERGLIMVYFGKDNYNNISAIGQMFRAVGRDVSVQVFDFTGTLFTNSPPAIEEFMTTIRISRLTDTSEKGILNFWLNVREQIQDGSYAMFFLHDVGRLMNNPKYVSELCELLENKKTDADVLLTGDHFPQEILEAADLITEVVNSTNTTLD